MNKKIFVLAAIMILASVFAVSAQDATVPANGEATVAENTEKPAEAQSPWKYFAAAIAVGVACIGGGLAVGKIGSAAMGAMSENPSLSGKALPFVGLAEGICLWGFLVGLLIIIL